MRYCTEKRQNVLKSMRENSLAVLLAGSHVKDSADGSYPFSVNRNFYYLTNIDEANVILLLVRGKKEEEILYIRKADPLQEKWVGKTISASEAGERSGIKDIRYLDSLDNDLETLVKENGINTVYVDDEEDPIIHFGLDFLDRYPLFDEMEVENLYPVIADLRTVKSPEEIEKMREAIHITNEGIMKMLENFLPGLKECELEAWYDYVLTCHKVPVSFHTIAAGAERATVLHYGANNQVVNDNEMILFDLGVAKDRWCSDISRTFPINGKFTERQRQVYDIVLRTQKKVEEAARPGVTLLDLQRLVLDSYQEELYAIGLIKEKTDEEVRKYYWHSISHSLGLDTHDVGLSRDMPLKAGMVITNEPGLYIEEWGIGVRIEDDILITETGAENLSKEIIKDPDEIEAYFRSRK